MSSKEKKKGALPKLRFPEFRDAGPWEVKKLSEVVEEVISNEQNNELPLYSLIINEGLKPKTGQYNREFLVKDKNSAYIVIKKNQFAYNPMNVRFGAIARLKDIDKAKISKYYNIFQVKDNNNPSFWEFYFLLPQMMDLYNRVAIGTLVEKRRIYLSDFLKLKIPVPSFPEQQKIADCLSSLDEVIELEAKKLEALKAHKKGLMQQLFPREGETTPRLRFPEFRDAGPWKKKPLREVLDYERPDKYIVNNDNYQSSGIPVLTANKSFILGYIDETYGIYMDVPVIIFDDFTTDKKFVNFSFKVKSSAIKILKSKDKNNIRFLYELMTLIKFDPQQHKRYYISEYQNIFVPIPEPEEQQKIADCLSSLDEVIELQTKKIELLKQYKKGLMQQLFPSDEEVRV